MSSTTASTTDQLEAIHSMMESGQQSVKMERHTLLIWGITAALLILLTDWLFSPDNLPVSWQRIAGQTVFISVILFIAGLWDFKLTKQVRKQRDESLSFVQLQVTKVWWFMVGLIVFINVGMNFFGGGNMFYGLTLALIGMAFYINGLFSTQMLKWIGMMLILMGATNVALDLHILASKWLAIGAFGLGLPILAFILDKPLSHSTLGKRLLLSMAWFAIVIFPSVIAYEYETDFDASKLQVRSVNEYKALDAEQAAQRQVITLPAGTEIPVNLDISGDMLDSNKTTAMVIKLSKPVDVVINEGKTTGHFRMDNTEWRKRIYHLQVQDFKMAANIDQQQGPSVNLGFKLEVR